MRNLKKFLALVLAMMMAMSLMVSANALNAKKDYKDIEGATFGDAIDILTGMGVFKGNNETFRPEAPITRAEAVAVLYRLVTGDVTDDRAELYAPAAKFTDVDSNAWYAGYVGFAVDAELVKGWNGTFMPSKPVTGYEMLAMLLRAVGYGKNGEFTGSGWMINVGARAESLKILDTIKSTNYKNTLSQPSAREVVAELTFRTAAYVRTVTWTQLGGYSEYSNLLGFGLNPTLGQREFNLDSTTGIVLANQATGAGKTMVRTNNTYSYTADDYSIEVDTVTTLAYFGHKVEVWHNGSGHAYAVLDRAELTKYVYAEDAVLSGGTNKLGDAAKAEGFDVGSSSTAHFSDRYSRIDAADAANASSNESPINTYAVISNNGDKTVDVVVALSAEVAKITQKNTTAKNPYVILGYSGGSGNDSTFGDGTTAGKILEKQLTSDSVKDLGKTVIAYEVVGTKKTLSAAAGINSNGDADCKYQLVEPKTFTATVSSYKLDSTTPVTVDGATSAVVSVNLVGRDKPMLLSGIVRGDGTNSEIISEALPVVESLKASTTYTVYEDIVGRFISLTTSDSYEFLYGTYADFEVGALGTGTIGYSIVGVNWGAEKQGPSPIKTWKTNTMTGTRYNTELTVTRKDYGNAGGSTGNQLRSGYYTGYEYNATTGDLRDSGAKRMADDVSWKIKSSDAANGFVKVKNSTADVEDQYYLLTKDTRFIVVSGTGTATLKADEYKGLADFLQGSAEALISFNADDTGGTKNQVIFKTAAEQYGTVDTDSNGVITDIILSTGNLNRWNATTMYFNFDQNSDTGLVLPGTDPDEVKQYELWCDGKVGYYFVDITATDGDDPGDAAMTFYNLVQIDEQGGVPIYKAVSAGKGNLTGDGYASNSATYEYITVSTLDTGLFKDAVETSGKVLKIADATVCDVNYKNTDGVSDTRSEITTLRELNNAVSVRQPNGTTTNYTISVAIVYDGINVSCIYVTNIATK